MNSKQGNHVTFAQNHTVTAATPKHRDSFHRETSGVCTFRSPQVAATFNLVAEPKEVERCKAIQATITETINTQEPWGFHEARSMRVYRLVIKNNFEYTQNNVLSQ